MKKTIDLITFFCFSVLLAALAFILPVTLHAAENTLYVTDGGTGDGSSAESPLGDLAAAIRKLGTGGGTIYLVGTVTGSLSANYNSSIPAFIEPFHRGEIVIDGSLSGARLNLGTDSRYYLSGPSVFRDITFAGSGAVFFVGCGNHITMDAGLDLSCFTQPVIYGGFNASTIPIPANAANLDYHVTVKSGKYIIVIFNRMTKNTTVNSTGVVEVYGGIISNIYAGSSAGNTASINNIMANAEVRIYGGSIVKITDMDAAYFGKLDSLTVYYEGGQLDEFVNINGCNAVLRYTAETAYGAKKLASKFTSVIAPDGEAIENKAVRIACVGDSITYGTKSTVRMVYSYPAQLQTILGKGGYLVENFGCGSTRMINTAGAYIKTDEYTQSLAFEPDIVLLMLGTNDVHVLGSETWKKQFYNDALSLIKSYQELPSAPVIYLLASTARTDTAERASLQETLLYPLQKQLAEEAGCVFVDMYTLTCAKPWLFADYLHPGDVGYGYMASYLAGILSENASGADKEASDAEETEQVLTQTVSETVPAAASGKDSTYKIAFGIITVLLAAATVIFAMLLLKAKRQ